MNSFRVFCIWFIGLALGLAIAYGLPWWAIVMGGAISNIACTWIAEL